MLIKFNFKYWQRVYYNNSLKLHSLDNPSICNTNQKFFYKDGNFHRENGPAIDYGNGYKNYYLNGKYYEEKEYWSIIKKIRFKAYL